MRKLVASCLCHALNMEQVVENESSPEVPLARNGVVEFFINQFTPWIVLIGILQENGIR
ncbi:MAG: hypothetical protein IPI45_14420 [Saprospiraceae bacterium]|nr:hypothetical protein [Saprospiraceae bacterium]